MLDSTPAAGDPLFDAKVAVRHADWIADHPEEAIEELCWHETFREGGRSITLAASFDWSRIAPGPEPPSLKRYRVERGDQAIDWLEFHYRPGGPKRFRLGRPDQTISVESIDVVRAWARCLADFGRRVLADYGIGDARPHELPTVNRAVSPKVMALYEVLRDSYPQGLLGKEIVKRMGEKKITTDEQEISNVLKKQLIEAGCDVVNQRGVGYSLVPLRQRTPIAG